MPEIHEIRVPDLGDYADVPVIEIPVKPGETIARDQTLLIVESDKATLDIPSPVTGRLVEMLVGLGDTVSAGTLVARLAASADAAQPAPAPVVPANIEHTDADCDVLVIGGGPGGYSAAFRAADLGQRVILVERDATLGGVCLNVGCIPSKALLHVASVTEEAQRLAAHGISFGAPAIDLDKLRRFKAGTVRRLTDGLTQMARQRKVTVIRGTARFSGANAVTVALHAGGEQGVIFRSAIVAAGSSPVALPMLPEDPRIVNSTGALELPSVPRRLLVIGGGIIGLEMATVYSALGARVDVVERLPNLLEGVDRDLVAIWTKRNAHRFDRLLTGAEVVSATAGAEGIAVTLAGETQATTYDLVLQAAGRRPNGAALGLEAAGVTVEGGFVPVDAQMRTTMPHILAIGDLVGQPMLAHKAVHQGHVAAEVAAGHRAGFDAAVIPSVAYTDPEIAWAGLTETGREGGGAGRRGGALPLGRLGPGHRQRRGLRPDQAAVRARDQARGRRRHRGPERGRPDRRGRARHRDGGGRRRYRPDDPSASDARRDCGSRAEAALGLCTDLPPVAHR